MRAAAVQIGGVYHAKVSGKMVKVKITALCGGGGRDWKPHWLARNLATKREIVIKSAQRLRPLIMPELQE